MFVNLTRGYGESALFLLVVFFLMLRLRGVHASEAFWLPIGGLVWGALLGLVLAVPLSLFSELDTFEKAFVTATPWVNLLVVPIYVWRRVPEALLPKVKLSELVLWNVTATGLSFGAWAASMSLPAVFFWGFVYLVWLWPSAFSLLVRYWRDKKYVRLLTLPLVFYYWISLLYWLLSSLIQREPLGGGVGLLGLGDAVFESFAAIQCFAVLYLLYYTFLSEEQFFETEVNRRVGRAIENAVEIDEWPMGAFTAAASFYGVVILAFSWANASRGWGLPTYWLLLLPYILCEVVTELSSSSSST